jgi:diguanylate cyclase (GGDEF)-like protein/PAS domain S-box-containing protein
VVLAIPVAGNDATAWLAAGKTLWIILAGVFGAVVLGALVAVQWTLSMRRQVARRTAELDHELIVRRQTEEELSASEERHRLLFEQLSDALFVETLDGRILNVNESACKLLGYTHEELTQMTVPDLLPPGAPGFLPQEIDAATIHENIIETANKRKDGSVVPVELRGRVLKIDGQPRLLVSLRDITKRVRLQKIQSVLQQIAEAVNLTVDLDALFPAIRRILGALLDTTNFRIALYDRESDTISMPYMVDEQDTYRSFIAGKSFTSYVVKENKSLLLTQEKREEFIRSAKLDSVGHAAKVWLGVPLRMEKGVIGALIVQSYTDPSLYTEDEVNILELVADQVSVAITRKQNEEALQEREEQYHSIFESTTDAVLIFNLDGKIVAANPIANSLYGYGEGELIGLSAEKLVRPDYFHGFKNFRKRVEDGGRFEVDSVNLRKDGTPFDIEMHGAGFSYQGEPHLLSVVRDITARKEAEERLRKSSQKIVRLHAVAQYLEGCEDEDETYRATVEAAEKILNFMLASLDIVEGDKLVVKATSAELPPDASRESPLANGGLAAKTYRTRETTIFGSMNEVPEAAPTREEFRSGISAPIGDIGVFQVVSTDANAFTDEDARLLELLLGHTNEAVKRIRLQAELRAQAMRDPLTGIYNRRYFNQVVEQEINRSKRYNHPIAFLMIDINRFKEINDRFGHQMGDSILQQVASLLLNAVREADIVVRYGGDEFLIVLPETNGEADVVMQRIHRAVDSRNETNELIPFPVTLAIGSAHWEPDQDRPVAQVLAEADQFTSAEDQHPSFVRISSAGDRPLRQGRVL